MHSLQNLNFALPVGEITIWSNLLIGVAAALLAAMSVFRQPRAVSS